MKAMLLTAMTLGIALASCNKRDAKPESYETMTLVYRVTTPNDGRASISYHVVNEYDYTDSLVYFAPNEYLNGVRGRTEWVFKQEASVGDMAQVSAMTRSLNTIRIEIWVESEGCKKVISDFSQTGEIINDTGGIFLKEEMFYKCQNKD